MTNYNEDLVFQALSHSTRREILDVLKATPGLGVGELAQSFDVSRIAIMNHLALLEKANLVVSEREGRTRHLYFNVMPIQEIYMRWSDEYGGIWSDRLSIIKDISEATSKRLQGEQ